MHVESAPTEHHPLSDTHLLDVVFRQRLRGDVDRVLLHVLGHVRIFDDRLSLFRHGGGRCVRVRREKMKGDV